MRNDSLFRRLGGFPLEVPMTYRGCRGMPYHIQRQLMQDNKIEEI